MPGLTSRRWACLGAYSATSLGSAGLGPTTDMSPKRTLRNWGSSSMEVLRMIRPTRVTRGSSRILNTGPVFSFMDSTSERRSSASGTMERNFHMRKHLPSFPTRSWAKKTGPEGSSTLMATATIRNSQLSSISTAALKAMSKARLRTR